MTASGALRVLIVAEDRADARLVNELSRAPGFPAAEIVQVGTVAAALERARDTPIDAVILDLTLPDARGLDALSRVRSSLPDVPVVVLTGPEDLTTALRAMQAGAQDSLVKAEATPPLLARALRYAIERSRLEAKKREEAIRQSAQLREQFIAILSHDLRGPLSSIAMNAALLIEKAELTERQLKTVARISRSAGRMSRMIRDLLDFTRARLGGGFELVRAKCSLAEICTQVVEEIETAHPDRTLRVQISGRGWGSWDADRMAQMMSNLIGNGLRYSPPDAPVRISLLDERTQVSFEVSNDGDAIPAENLPTMFEPYVRVHTTAPSGGTHGLGLGLYIANQIVLAHGGRIDVRSAPGAGTTFRVVLGHNG